MTTTSRHDRETARRHGQWLRAHRADGGTALKVGLVLPLAAGLLLVGQAWLLAGIVDAVAVRGATPAELGVRIAGLAGLILAPTRALGPKALAGFQVPVVLVDRALAGGRRDAVVLDNIGATGQLVDHLVATGRRRIAGLFGATSATGLERRDGFRARMQDHGLHPIVATAAPSPEAGRKALADLIAAERPDALVLSNGLFVGAALRLCRDLGISVPRDLAIAGFDDEPWTSLVDPGITVIRQPVDAFGREAMVMLQSRIARPDQPFRTVVLSGELIARGSTAPA